VTASGVLHLLVSSGGYEVPLKLQILAFLGLDLSPNGGRLISQTVGLDGFLGHRVDRVEHEWNERKYA
jgi:hypothetical protein